MVPTKRRRPPRAGALTELPPTRILRSILLLQLSYYFTALVLILFTTLTLGQPFRLGLLFDWHEVRGDNTLGWTIAIVWLLVGFITVIPILLLISRSKLVPDFALTIHLLNLIVTSLYTKAVPTNLLWWSLSAGSAFMMVSLGVWGCRYREMQPISFGNVPASGTAVKTTASTEGDTAGGEIRGGNGGRHTGDGGPSYEMVDRGGGEGGLERGEGG